MRTAQRVRKVVAVTARHCSDSDDGLALPEPARFQLGSRGLQNLTVNHEAGVLRLLSSACCSFDDCNRVSLGSSG
jgi:hypothetical protein